MPPPDGPQFRRIIHLSDSGAAPHTVDHDMADIYRNDKTDRKYTNEVVFAADEADFDVLNKEMYRENVHAYDVPEDMLSVERFGDDDLEELSGGTYAYPGAGRTSQPELWESIPASRKDAVTRQKVMRFTNSFEAPGKQSYIVPKTIINDGRVRYVGRKTQNESGNWNDDWEKVNDADT
jgi:hypothetical protein